MIKIAESVVKDMAKERSRISTAARQSLSSEAYAARILMQRMLRGGELGLTPKRPWLKKNRKGQVKVSKAGANKPLASLRGGIIYKVFKAAGVAEVGFLGSTSGTLWQKKLAEKHLAGYTIPYSDATRRMLARHGIFVRKTTTSVSVPSRDIVGNFSSRTVGQLERDLGTRFKEALDERVLARGKG